jgi:hypothetical protein
MKFLICMFFPLTILNPLWAQALRISGSQLLEKSALPQARKDHLVLQSVRLDAGKLWINGNLLPQQEVPPSLQALSRQTEFYASFQGIRSVELLMEGNSFLIQPGRVSDISKISGTGPRNPLPTDQVYMEKLRQESPETFKALSLEAELNQRAHQLSRAFLTTADLRKKAEIRTDLRRTLDQLFDLNIRNQSEELEFLESQIALRKEELKIKQGDKTRLVAKNLSELTELK